MEPDMEKAREMSASQGGAAEYRPQAHEDEPVPAPIYKEANPWYIERQTRVHIAIFRPLVGL
jgi:hypothetical protein